MIEVTKAWNLLIDDAPDDAPLTLARIARELDMQYQSVWHWYKYGRNGIRLQTWTVGGRRYTTKKALQDFTRAARAKRGPQYMLARAIADQAAEPAGAETGPQTGEPATGN